MISLLLQQFTGSTIQVLPCCVICYLFSAHYFRLPERVLRLHLFFLMALTLGCFTFISLFLYNAEISHCYLILNLLFMICVLVFALYLFHASMLPFWKKAFAFIFAFNYGLFIGLIKNSLCSQLLSYGLSELRLLYSPLVLSIVIIAEVVTFPIVLHFLLKILWVIDYLADDKIWRRLTLVNLAFCFIYYVYSVRISIINIQDILLVLTTIVVFFAQILLMVFACYIFSRMVYLQQEQSLTENIHKQLQIQEIHYSSLNNSIHEAKRIDHDLRHHLRTLQALLSEGNIAQARDYLNSFAEKPYIQTPCQYCSNHFINATLSYYLGKAVQENIEVRHAVSLDQEIPFDEIDLCVIIGNCLENALEAVRLLPSEQHPYIHIKGAWIQDCYLLSIRNPYLQSVKKEGTTYVSTKHEGSGIGIYSVKKIAEKYHGSVDLKTDDHIFEITVTLQPL